MKSKFFILGAGAVGLQLGGRLARAGHRVIFVTRRPEAARAIRKRGILLRDLASARRDRVQADATTEWQSAGPLADCPVLLCLRAGQERDPIRELADLAPNCLPICCQNGVDGEARLARYFSRVVGLVLRQTCTRTDDTQVASAGRGHLILGLHPRGIDDSVRWLAECFQQADFDVGLSECIVEDRWLKLFFNLTSAVNALVRRPDHSGSAFVELKVRLLEEAHDVFTAAGISARSGNGLDRSLVAEIAAQRAALENGSSGRSLPLYNSVWSALQRPDVPLEADAHHSLILKLARDRGVPAPTHATLLRALLDCRQRQAGPECLRAADLLAESEHKANSRPDL